MNVEFEAALKYIDLGSYDKAVSMLNTAIEKAGGDTDEGMQYRCVLGELYANIGNVEKSREEFTKVLDYMVESHTLEKQRQIASTYLDAFDGKLPMPQKKIERPGDAPIVPKPRQNAAFIAKKTRKR